VFRRYPHGMRSESRTAESEVGEMRFEGGCLVCGGDLEVRLVAGRAGSYCRTCHWISRPRLERHDGQVSLAHPPGGFA
jgi:hypothetical protein